MQTHRGAKMKVGDLVTYSSPAITGNFVGIVVEVGAWTGNCDIKVLWSHEKVAVTQKSFHLKAINESG
tara:strand:+ start:101 stop:304 length:204 start_codon:yes stop_codon:yes gene_type:complete